MGKDGSVSARKGAVMSQDAPVNTGVVAWPGLFAAEQAVARMQTKLHLWAARDKGRRFGDLFNLVYDPAFLRVAWERVATNKGASTCACRKPRPCHATR
jgi:RNA-directed DNA polymerase